MEETARLCKSVAVGKTSSCMRDITCKTPNIFIERNINRYRRTKDIHDIYGVMSASNVVMAASDDVLAVSDDVMASLDANL